MLIEVSKKDKIWRKIAFKICKDKDLADDLVQEMYLKISSFTKLENTEIHITTIIKNLFIDYTRNPNYIFNINSKDAFNSKMSDLELAFNKQIEVERDFNETEQKLLKASNNLKFYELELLYMSGQESLRDLGKRYNIKYGTIHKIVKKSKEKLWQEVKNQK